MRDIAQWLLLVELAVASMVFAGLLIERFLRRRRRIRDGAVNTLLWHLAVWADHAGRQRHTRSDLPLPEEVCERRIRLMARAGAGALAVSVVLTFKPAALTGAEMLVAKAAWALAWVTISGPVLQLGAFLIALRLGWYGRGDDDEPTSPSPGPVDPSRHDFPLPA